MQRKYPAPEFTEDERQSLAQHVLDTLRDATGAPRDWEAVLVTDAATSKRPQPVRRVELTVAGDTTQTLALLRRANRVELYRDDEYLGDICADDPRDVAVEAQRNTNPAPHGQKKRPRRH